MLRSIYLILIFIHTTLPLHAMQGSGSIENAIWNFEQLASATCHCKHGLKISLEPQNSEEIANDQNIVFDQMRKAPLELLRHCQNSSKLYKQDSSKYASLEIENPIFLLNECSHVDCPLTRQDDTKRCPRSISFDVMKNQVLNNFHTKEIVTAIFASGHGFYDLNLLVSLYDSGYRVSKLVLIDPIFSDINLLLSFVDDNKINLENTVYKLKELNFKSNIITALRRINQFMHAAKALHKGIELFVFDSADHYISCSHEEIEADLVVGFDFVFSEMAPRIFYSLANKTKDEGKLVAFTANCNQSLRTSIATKMGKSLIWHGSSIAPF